MGLLTFYTICPLLAAKVIVHVLLVPGFIWLMPDEDGEPIVFIERPKNGGSSHGILLLHTTGSIWSIGNRPCWNIQLSFLTVSLEKHIENEKSHSRISREHTFAFLRIILFSAPLTYVKK